MIRKSLMLAIALCALLPIASANASYTITKSQAERMARDAAEIRYGNYGITYADSAASCTPQYVRYNPRFAYHRWVCGWAGRDMDGDMAGGVLRITGHTGNGNYGHLVLRGISWE